MSLEDHDPLLERLIGHLTAEHYCGTARGILAVMEARARERARVEAAGSIALPPGLGQSVQQIDYRDEIAAAAPRFHALHDEHHRVGDDHGVHAPIQTGGNGDGRQ
jgi:hypothetical protein